MYLCDPHYILYRLRHIPTAYLPQYIPTSYDVCVIHIISPTIYKIIYREYMMWITCIYCGQPCYPHHISMLFTTYDPQYICTCVTHTIYCIVYGMYPQHISHSIYPHHMMYVLSTTYRSQYMYIKSYTVSI